ncbi:cytochrome P450 [Mycena crocata]|nr:cytochrome P450 [Mycena crocata]
MPPGNMIQLMLSPQYGDYEFHWLKLYGPVYRIMACFGVRSLHRANLPALTSLQKDRLMVSDPAALQYILNSPHFDRSAIQHNYGTIIFGKKSIFEVDGNSWPTEATHKRLRAGLNFAFTASAVRNYQTGFEKVAQTMADQLEVVSTEPVIDLLPFISITTLSAVSEAVLGCATQDLDPEFVENSCAIMYESNTSSSQSATQILSDAIGSYFPPCVLAAATYLPTRIFKIVRKEKYLAGKLGSQLVREKLDVARKGLERNNDVFSMLLSPDTSVKAMEALSGDDVAAQTSVFIIAGQDTTANTLAFAFHQLARDPVFQAKLRAEIHSILGAERNNIVYDNMPVLNAFMKELLRMYPTEPLPERIAIQDTLIPLREPVKTSTGELLTQLSVCKGQAITLGLAGLDSCWGDDAHIFKPSRWIDGTPCRGEAIGPYANLWRFAYVLNYFTPARCLRVRIPDADSGLIHIRILEMQVIICELVGKFSFTLTNEYVETRLGNTIYPAVAGKKRAPLHITRML